MTKKRFRVYDVLRFYQIIHSLVRLEKRHFMLIKNKFYFSIIIVLFLADIVILLNENLMANNVGVRIFYTILTVIFIMVIIGVSKKRRH